MPKVDASFTMDPKQPPGRSLDENLDSTIKSLWYNRASRSEVTVRNAFKMNIEHHRGLIYTPSKITSQARRALFNGDQRNLICSTSYKMLVTRLESEHEVPPKSNTPHREKRKNRSRKRTSVTFGIELSTHLFLYNVIYSAIQTLS